METKGHYLQDAWERGLIIGVIASPDHTSGEGKVGVWAKELTRESLFEAIRARHTFGTSGAKMAMRLWTEHAIMGDKIERPAGSITLKVSALAFHEIKELVIFRNNRIVHRVEPNAKAYETEWTDDAPPNEKLLWYYARIHASDDELAWTSPIWYVG